MYVSGFVIPVPEGNKAAYRTMAAEAWTMFADAGALEIFEGWEEDIEDGELTDFHRAVAAEPGEKIVFSWVSWPDKDTAHRCYAKMREMDPTSAETPFDAKRMIWGGFTPLFTMGRD
jgi:uncharacterized protein YbaA (DUF1428 family)